MDETRESNNVRLGGSALEMEASNAAAPKDRCRLVYLIFFCIGIGTLLPWNFFINATQYFQYQLRNKSLPSDVNPLLPMYRTQLQTVFSSYLTICSMVPLSICNILNLMIKDCIPVFYRLLASAVLMLSMFIITTTLTRVATETYVFFILTLTIAALSNVGSSINQGSTYGILSFLPGSNARGFLEGQAVAGIIASVANIITISAASTPLDVGFAYFIIATCIIAFTICLFVLLFKNAYFRYYWKSEGSNVVTDESPCSIKVKRIIVNLWHAMWEVRWTGLTAFLTFTATLTVFPNVFVLVIPNNFDETNVWHTRYFHAVVVFLSFNICDYLGRMLVRFVKWPKFDQKKLFLCLAVVRFVIVPLAMFCNIGSRIIPVAFYHDAVPIILIIILGLTNGYFVSLAVIYAPR
uniref:Equilibrative nucleoside transporter 1 n=1 Tax=Mesocestoides corti TaxID=53468 RepID=A0A5K3G263_MESCO